MKGWLGATLGTFLVASLSATAPADEPLLSPSPGTYPSPLVLSVNAPPGTTVRYRFVEVPSAQEFPWSSDLSLEALPGEHRLYTVRLIAEKPSGESTTRDFRYTVQGLPRPQATIRPVPGTYTASIALHPTLPPGCSLTVDGRPSSPSPVLDALPGARKTYVLEAQGPEDSSLAWVYQIDRRDQDGVALDVLSPVEGAWANSQPLVVTFQGVDRVLWSYGPHLNLSSAQAYRGPTDLPGTGTQTITVGGRSRIDGTWVERTVTWSSKDEDGPPGWPGSGVVLDRLALPANPGWQISWDAGNSWQPDPPAHVETSSTASRKVLVAEAKKGDLPYRLVWWLDSRSPGTPVVQFSGGWNPQLVVSGSFESLYRVVWTWATGRSQEDPITLWGPLGIWKIPDGVVGARVTALGSNGQAATPVSIGFSETGWPTPGWEPWDLHGPLLHPDGIAIGGRVPARPGFRVAYEVSDQPEVPEPTESSPWLEGAFFPKAPWGDSRTLYARFAWRDDSGLTGPASSVVTVHVDRLPPLAPEVEVEAGQVFVRPASGSPEAQDLFWAVSSDRVDSTDTLTFRTYTHPLLLADLLPPGGGKVWFHARAQNQSGNAGPGRLNVGLAPSVDPPDAVVQVDPDPAVGELPVTDGGVYPWSSLRLRPVDRTHDFWVGVADPSQGVPTDWASQLQPWKGVVSRPVPPGERQDFLVYWNAKNSEGWLWPEPKVLRFTLDQGRPAPPLVQTDWPSAPVAGPWTLSLKPGQPGDRLLVSATTDGTLPPDPLAAALVWPGSQTWAAPDGRKLTVRIRVTAVSVSGIPVEMPPHDPVVLDRSVPAAVVPAVDSFTFKSDSWTIPAPSVPGLVRYTLTADGSSPGVPGDDSPALGPGLVLAGTPGQSVLYRFRWRPFSETGVPGPVTEPYAVLVDRTVAPGHPSPEASLPRDASAPRIEGLPPSGLSSQPVTLTLANPGEFRYELSEGVAPPREVTSLSPVWDHSLVLDGGEGVDRTFEVQVRAFGPDGSPGPEVHYTVRVDRSSPLAPAVDLVADAKEPRATLQVSPGGGNSEQTLFYRWRWSSFPDGPGESDWQTWGPSAPIFSAPERKLTRLTVEVYARDEAGNQGPTTTKSVLLDQNVVYVQPNGSGDGTRSHPMGALSEALAMARQSKKSLVYLATGSYSVGQSLDVGGLQLMGGMMPDQWEATPTPGRSVLNATTPFQGTSLVYSGNQDWSLSHIDLTSAGGVPRVVLVRGARVRVQTSAWTWAASGGWEQEGGSVSLDEVNVLYTAQPKAELLKWKDVEVDVQRFSVVAVQNHDGVLFSFQGARGLLKELSVVSKKSEGFEGVIAATDSNLVVDHARILAGDGASRATGFVLKQSEARFANTEVSLYASESNTGFQTSGGSLTCDQTNLSILRGSEFNQGLVVDHGEATLENFVIKVASGGYQGGVSMDGGTLSLSNGKVELSGGGQQVWGAEFLDPTLVTLDDTTWVLDARTPGELWKMNKPWLPGSQVKGSTTPGW